MVGIKEVGSVENCDILFVATINPFHFHSVNSGPQNKGHGLILILIKTKTPEGINSSE